MKYLKTFEGAKSRVPLRKETDIEDDTYYIMPSHVRTTDDFGKKIAFDPGDILRVHDIGGMSGLRFSYNGKDYWVPVSDFEEWLDSDCEGESLTWIDNSWLKKRLEAAGLKSFGKITDEEYEAMRGKRNTKKFGI